jgi:hypothetical protein
METEHLPSTKETAMEKKISLLNVKRNVSEGERELKSDTKIIGEK